MKYTVITSSPSDALHSLSWCDMVKCQNLMSANELLLCIPLFQFECFQ